MRAFGLSKELCLEFLRKQSTIANLKKGMQCEMDKPTVMQKKDALPQICQLFKVKTFLVIKKIGLSGERYRVMSLG